MTTQNTLPGFSNYFSKWRELPVMLNDIEYENKVGTKCNDENGFYKNGYSVMEGYEKLYIKIYTVIGGVVEIDSEIVLNKLTNKVVKYTGEHQLVNLMKLLKDGEKINEMDDILTSLVKSSIKRSLDKLKNKLGMETSSPSLIMEEKKAPRLYSLCEYCNAECDPFNQCDGMMLCGDCDETIKSGLCPICEKVDEACQC